MIVRQISDLHNEMYPYEFTITPADKDATLVIPGDIDCVRAKARYGMYLEYLSKCFKYVVFTAGNHEYWSRSILQTSNDIRKIIKERKLTNVFYLQNDTVVLDGVAFIGATFWTNIKNPLVELQVQEIMNDYRRIRIGPENMPWQRKLRVSDTTMLHYESRGYIEAEAKKQKLAGNKVVVVTHHAPSFKSVCPKYQDDVANPAYCSALDYWLMEGDIDYWMHGHIHWKHDYVIGHCRVTCNPRGYYSPRFGGELTNMNHLFYVDIL